MENREAQESQKNVARKDTFRKQVWLHFKKNKLSNFQNVFGRIPSFKGMYQAASQLLNLEEFKLAKSVEVSPDKPLEPSRVLVLENGKDLYVPVPQLRENFLKKLIPQDGMSIKKIVSRWGIDNTGLKIDLNDEIHIDLLIVSSVAVSKEGYRIGKGKGYADLEYACLREMNAVNDDTVIVTTVHDSQVFDDLPKNMFEKHDVPVDYILTPTRIIKVENKLPRPAAIFWDLLTQNQVNRIDILKKLRKKLEREGKLLPISTETNSQNRLRRVRRRFKRSKTKLDGPQSNAESLKGSENKTDCGNTVKEELLNSDTNKLTDNTENVPPKPKRKRFKHPIDFSLLVGNIGRNVRVKHLKKALAEKNVKPDMITWKGYRGFCYLHYTSRNNNRNQDKRKPFSIDNVIEILGGLKITPECKQHLTVKVMEPITRIETTDVTTV